MTFPVDKDIRFTFLNILTAEIVLYSYLGVWKSSWKQSDTLDHMDVSTLIPTMERWVRTTESTEGPRRSMRSLTRSVSCLLLFILQSEFQIFATRLLRSRHELRTLDFLIFGAY